MTTYTTNLFLIAVSLTIIIHTASERLSYGSASALLVVASIFSVFGITIAVSNIRSEMKRLARK